MEFGFHLARICKSGVLGSKLGGIILTSSLSNGLLSGFLVVLESVF